MNKAGGSEGENERENQEEKIYVLKQEEHY